jgi:hypothetical protein
VIRVTLEERDAKRLAALVRAYRNSTGTRNPEAHATLDRIVKAIGKGVLV